MTTQDLFITPIYIILFSLIAFFIRPFVTTPETRKFFIPALWVKFFGAIMLGVIYQFYYGGGDTFNYFTHGSRWIWEAFMEEPEIGLKLFLSSGGEHQPESFQYSSRIWYYRDERSYFIVRIAAFFDLFTFHTYSSTALFFALFSFSGLWAVYSAIHERYSNLQYLHIAILFIPSVAFWGSGILKDTITIGALGWLTWAFFLILEKRRIGISKWLVIILSSWLIFQIKSYILLCFLGASLIWFYLKNISLIKNAFLKVLMIPVITAIFVVVAISASRTFSSGEYSIHNFAYKASVTAYDIRYGWGARFGGDGGYDLGGLPDGSIQSVIRLMPAAINVSLFRPYIWEVRNPLMLLTSLESMLVLFGTLFVIIRRKWLAVLNNPFMLFSLMFALLFSFAVGVSTYNFGTLMRYKIPMMPFYTMVLVFGYQQWRTT